MALAFKRILMITHNVQFAIDTKRALESLGNYEVTTITDANNAINILQNKSHNIVLMDVENLEIPTLDMVKGIRSTQTDVAIILAPSLPDVHDIATILDVQGVVDLPAPVRQLIPIFEQSVQDIFDSLPETARAPAVDTQQETVYIETLVDELLGDDETPYFTSRQVQAHKRSLLDKLDDDVQHSNTIEVVIESDGEDEKIRYVESLEDVQGDRSLLLFQRLAEEEPPMPSLSQSGTISDLVRNVTQSNQLSIIEVDEDETEARTVDEVIEDIVSDSIPAILVLTTALDETTPIEAINLKNLYDNIQNRLPPEKQSIRPLPSWLKEGEKFIREPLFLQDGLDYLDSQRPMEYTSTNTQPSDGTIVISDSSNLETEVIEAERPFVADDLLHEDEDYDIDDLVEESDAEDFVDDVVAEDETDTPEVAEDIDEIEEGDAVSEPVSIPTVDDDAPTAQPEDPYIAQLAVTLTQVTTELTAEATILTRDNAIVAYSGDMPIEDIDDVRTVIDDDWSASADNARIRFITLPSSGNDYMLYSKGTVGGFTLSMVFAGTRQLRVIRRQGERLIHALQATPDVEAVDEPDEVLPVLPDENEIEDETLPRETDKPKPERPREQVEPVDVGPKLPYTFIWLIDDFEVQLAQQVAKQLLFWLETQLNGAYWTIHKLDVHQDFVYLYADVPGNLSPASLIRQLMERSEKIVRSEDDTLPQNLWADAYLVLTPGREMTDREIQRFLNFARDEG